MGRLTEIYRVAHCEPYESDVDVSYHRTREGADRRVREHKQAIVAEVRELSPGVTLNLSDERLWSMADNVFYGDVSLTAVTLED